MSLRMIETWATYNTQEAIFENWTGMWRSQAAENTGLLDDTWWSISPTGGRTTPQCLLYSGPTGAGAGKALFLTLDPQSTWIIGMAVYPLSGTNGDPLDADASAPLFSVADGGGYQVCLSIRFSDMVLQCDLGEHVVSDIPLAKGKCAIGIGGWFYIEAKIVIGAAGSIEVRINDMPEMTFSGNTDRMGSGVANQVVLFGSNNTTAKGSYYLSDFYICDANGARNNDFIGSHYSVYPSFVQSQGDAISWTPLSGGDNSLMVNDTTPDSSATYNFTNSASRRDLFNLGDLPATFTSSAIIGVGHYVNARYSNVGNYPLELLFKHPGTETVQNCFSVFGSWIYRTQIYEINPVTGTSFSIADVNNMQLGYRTL